MRLRIQGTPEKGWIDGFSSFEHANRFYDTYKALFEGCKLAYTNGSLTEEDRLSLERVIINASEVGI